MSSNLHKLINNRQLADTRPALDDGGSVYFPQCIGLLTRITPLASHVEKLSAQGSRCVLLGPQRVEGPR